MSDDAVVESVLMPRVPHIHLGSGPYIDVKHRAVLPASVPGPSNKLLEPTVITASAFCYFFKTTDPSLLPSHFAAAVSPAVKDFSNVNVFFHPIPGATHPPLQDSDYPLGGGWPELYRYCPHLGLQLSASGKQQVLIVPFIPQSEYASTGDLAANWRSIFTDIVRQIQADVTGTSSNFDINSMVVSSFSTGIQAASAFRSRGKAITDVLAEIWDMDGLSSTQSALAKSLHAGLGFKVIQYQQSSATKGKSFFVGANRWAKIEPLIKTLTPKEALKAVHRGIPKGLFYHMATESTVG